MPPTPTWPTLAALSSNNWPYDHFGGGSLDATKWTALTSGTGAVSLTDSYCDVNLPASTDAALIYAQQGIPTNKSQLWAFAFSRQSDGSADFFYVVEGTPSLGTQAAVNPNVRLTSFIAGASPSPIRLGYFGAGHSWNTWNGSAWQSGGANAGATARDNDYYVVALEIDGVNRRWRQMVYGNAYTTEGTYQQNQGGVLIVQTAWVNFSAMETCTNLYLCLGRLYTDIGTAAAEFRYEWVRYGEGPMVELWADHKTYPGGTNAIRHFYSFDGQLFVPEDYSADALAVTASAWDSAEVQEPYVVTDGAGNLYMFYQGDNDNNTTKIGVAKAAYVAGGPNNGPWTKGANNPILDVSGTAESILYSPFVVYDQAETDPNKRWKMLYAARSSADNHVRIYGATAPDPPDTSTWTRQGLVIDLGGAGALDETYAENPFAIRRNGQWEVWYNGRDSANVCHTLRATGQTLFAQTKDGHGTYRDGLSTAATALGATPTAPDRTLTVGSTAGFAVDQDVSLEVDGTSDHFSVGQVRKVVSGTQLELYTGVTGFNTTYPSPIEAAEHSVTFNHRSMVLYNGTEWWIIYEVWGYWQDHSPSFGTIEQDTHLAKIASVDPTAAPITFQHLPGRFVPLGNNNAMSTTRAASLLQQPYGGDRPPYTRPAHLGPVLAQ